ncbi:MAG: STAS domain-containing protein [Bacteroidota bacterium]
MEIKVTQHEGYSTLAPAGDLDANSSLEMDSYIQESIDKGIYNIHVDCSGLQYISSAGLGVFISFMEELGANGGKFVFSDMSENVYKVFQLLGLEALMTIVRTNEEARNALIS